jgi:small subunit ribosomal protein S7
MAEADINDADVKPAQPKEQAPDITKKAEDVKPSEQQAVPEPKKKRAAPKQREESRELGLGVVKLFGKYDYDVMVSDPSLKNYINLRPVEYPNSFRRGSNRDFSKSGINVVERLENYLMRGGTGKKIGSHVIRTKGRLQGKKLKVMHIIEAAFEKVADKTKENPLQILIRAIENSAPIEDTTRVRYGGVVANVTVDISASKRLDIALRNIAFATVIGAFDKKKSIVDALADELVMTANNDINSYAIKRKNEIERMARSAR